MGPYLAVYRARFRMLLQYRAAALAGFTTQCWWGLIRIMVLAAFYQAALHPPLTLPQAAAYVWLGQGLFALLPWSADPEVGRLVRSGDVSLERLRPVDAYGYWLARALARRTAAPLLRLVPMVLMAAVVLPLAGLPEWALPPPASPAAGLLFAASLAGLVALASTMSVLLDILVAATLSDRGVNTLATPLVFTLSGMVVPLPMFPDWLQPVLFAQPFAGLADIPFRIYSGDLAGSAALAGVLLQAGWSLVLTVLGRQLIGLTMARLQVQGG